MVYALLLGTSLGLGLLAKYAAIYFLLCVAIDAWSNKRAREGRFEEAGPSWRSRLRSR